MITKAIATILTMYGVQSFILIFCIIFIETGLVFIPFLPGDSLLFITGTFLATSGYQPIYTILLLSLAAILGDFVNYCLGKKYGLHLREIPIIGKWIKETTLQRTEHFFARHGQGAIFIGRFIPIIRTCIPFVAGIGKMKPVHFFRFNILGGVAWVSVGVLAGYFFGRITFVKQHFAFIMLIIIFLSALPLLVIAIKKKVGNIYD